MEQSEQDEAPGAVGADAKRHVVAQATGVLVAQFGIDREAAFDKLAAMATDSDRPVVEGTRDRRNRRPVGGAAPGHLAEPGGGPSNQRPASRPRLLEDAPGRV